MCYFGYKIKARNYIDMDTLCHGPRLNCQEWLTTCAPLKSLHPTEGLSPPMYRVCNVGCRLKGLVCDRPFTRMYRASGIGCRVKDLVFTKSFTLHPIPHTLYKVNPERLTLNLTHATRASPGPYGGPRPVHRKSICLHVIKFDLLQCEHVTCKFPGERTPRSPLSGTCPPSQAQY